MSTIHYERIFTNSEIQDMEHQISYLMGKQKDIKNHCREEIKKIQLRLEKEIMDAQQLGNQELAKKIEKSVDVCVNVSKKIDEEVDKDYKLLREQVKHLENLRYEKDYWKELELKGVIGEDPQPKYDDFVKDCDKNFELARGHIDKKFRLMRKQIDAENFDEIFNLMNELRDEIPEDEPPIVPRDPQKDNEVIGFKTCRMGTYAIVDEKGTLLHSEKKDESDAKLNLFTIKLQPDDKIAIMTNQDKYLSATESGAIEMKDEITGDAQRFTMIIDDDEAPDKFAFKSYLNRYLSANDKGKIVQAIQLDKNEWFFKIYEGQEEPDVIKDESDDDDDVGGGVESDDGF